MFLNSAQNIGSVAPVASPVSASYGDILSRLIGSGWQVVTEGPSGAQMKLPRAMRTQTKVVLAIGIVGLLAFGLGLIFIAFALIDYYGGQKERIFFLQSESPAFPPEEPQRKTPLVIKILLGLLLALVALGLVAAALQALVV